MNDRNNLKIAVSIAAGVVFIIGFGIGVNLYSSTSENNKQEQINLRPLQQTG